MLATFNAFQVVVLFAAMPFICQWLSAGPFYGASAAFWLACVVYFVLFGIHLFSISDTFQRYR